MDQIKLLEAGLYRAFIEKDYSADVRYKPQLISNDYKKGKRVLACIEDELSTCDEFFISIAFITMSGIRPLLQTLKELENKNIPGKILTTDYLCFSEPNALRLLQTFHNIEIKMYRTNQKAVGFHTKGYIFKEDHLYRMIIGSSNMTASALTTNKEWNTKLVANKDGELALDIIQEFNELWESEASLSYDEFIYDYELKYTELKLIEEQKEIALREQHQEEYLKLKPNKMQVAFINNLRKIYEANEERALLISATGTGKTYASAFAMRELKFKKVLFLVHRFQLAKQTKSSYQKVFGNNISFGLVGGGYQEFDCDYIFAMVQTLNKEEYLHQFKPNHFDCIIIDEAHHSSANTYQRIMQYFKPKLWLGMSATPDKKDDHIEGKNIYEIFNYQIAYEIRLKQAMELNLLCPFHYFGISDISMIDEKALKHRKMNPSDFNLLTSDERVSHIVKQIRYYGYSGNKVKGLIFCSRIDESIILSEKFNALGYRTIALNGDASEQERLEAFERLALDENEHPNLEPLDYIFSVEILNEGVDIVEVNQVVMLRPTQSPIVFIQQLGRGLRKAKGKEHVVILDFIGNYKNNFMIPIALSGDKSYNPDTIRKYVISGNQILPGQSTIHFDEIAKEKIFKSIDHMSGMKAIIKNSYQDLKNRLGRIPYLIDFYENELIDPYLIIKEYKTYDLFLQAVEPTLKNVLLEDESLILEYLSKTILCGKRPYELEILRILKTQDCISLFEFKTLFEKKYGYAMSMNTFENAIKVLQGTFTSNEAQTKRYEKMNLINYESNLLLKRMVDYTKKLENKVFSKHMDDLIAVGLKRYEEVYEKGQRKDTMFILNEKYSRRDVCYLMNCGKDLSSTMYGMHKINDDVFIFVTYHKEASKDEKKNYVDGKPDYADVFENEFIFHWDSQIGRNIHSSYVKDIVDSKRKHLFVKKSDAESNFYYMGQFDVLEMKASKKKDNKGKERDITKFSMKMHHSVRADLLKYLQSHITI